VKPEAVVEIDGRRFDIGGLKGSQITPFSGRSGSGSCALTRRRFASSVT